MRRLLALAALALFACDHAPAPTVDLAPVIREHDRLKARFEVLAARDPVLAEVPASGADVVVGMRPAFVQAMVSRVASDYLDRVALDLHVSKVFHDDGDIQVKKGIFGTVKAGHWTVDGEVTRLRGVLAARDAKVIPAADNRLALAAPVGLQQGEVWAHVRFTWDSKGIANLLCRDFEVARDVKGTVLPGTYPVAGGFDLTAEEDVLRARPAFPARTFRLHFDLTPQSWKAVSMAIDEQDTLTKCGVGLDPDALIPRLEAILHRGFDVTLPASLFRPIELPASVQRHTEIEDHRVDLAVETRALQLTGQALWYAAAVRTELHHRGR